MRSSSVISGILLLFYLILVFLVCRALDLVAWWSTGTRVGGFLASRYQRVLLDPVTLSVKQLKRLLDVRGVDYTAVVDKKELAELAQQSGDVTVSEVEDIVETRSNGAAEFSGGPHLYEQVEDTKDSAWLVQVGGKPLLDDLTWHLVRHYMAPFSVRMGIFDCTLDPKLCISKGWREPLLLLAIPRGTKPKDTVFMKTSTLTKPQAVLDWVRAELSSRIKRVPVEEQDDWLSPKNSPGDSAINNTSLLPVRVLLFTHLLNPPLFLAALSIKFAGRISFGMITVKKGEENGISNVTNVITKVPSYLVITPEQTVLYGMKPSEHFTLKAMQTYLKAVQPDVNDMFLASLALVNMFALIYCFQICDDVGWARAVISCMVKVSLCNLILFICWLFMTWAIKLPFFINLFGEKGASIYRQIALSDFGANVRSDFYFLMESHFITYGTLFGYAYFTKKLLRKILGEGAFRSDGRHILDLNQGWLEFLLFRSPRHNVAQDGSPMEASLVIELSNNGSGAVIVPEGVQAESIDALLQQLVFPDLWLRQEDSCRRVPMDYVARLPTARYGSGLSLDSASPAELEAVMDATEREDALVPEVSTSSPQLLQPTTECSICLERYRRDSLICGLPCSHCFHRKCIVAWLERDHHVCPLCRWPSYKKFVETRKDN